MAEEHHKNKNWLWIIFGVAIVVIAIFVFVNQSQPKCRDVQIPYEAQQEYTEQEPYSDQQCTTEEFSYSVNSDYDTNSYPHEGKIRYDINFKITNNEDQAGGFKYQRHFRTLQEDYGCKSSWDNVPYEENPENWESMYIYAKSTQTIQCNLLLNSGVEYTSYLPQVVPPTKQDCQTITKYRETTKTRTVTKYRTEQQCN